MAFFSSFFFLGTVKKVKLEESSETGVVFSSASVKVFYSRENFESAQVKTNKVVHEQQHKGQIFISVTYTWG